MSAPGSKRKVMGRIDLAQDTASTSPSPRAYHTIRGTSSPSGVPATLSPPASRPVSSSGSTTVFKSKGHVRARVDMSSFSGMTNTPTSNSTSASTSSNPSTPKNNIEDGRLSPGIKVHQAINASDNFSSDLSSRASPSTFAHQNVTARNGIRSKVRNNSEDLSNLSGSSGSTGLTSNGVSSNSNVSSPKSVGSNTISAGIRGHSRSATSSHVSSIFPSASSSIPSTSSNQSNQPGRVGAKVSVKPIGRSRTPSPTRNERPNINRFGSNISGSSHHNSNLRGVSTGFPPSSPKKEFSTAVFQPATSTKREGTNLAPAYETPLTSPEQPQSSTGVNLTRANSISHTTPTAIPSNPVRSPPISAPLTNPSFYAHAYGKPNSTQPASTVAAVASHSRNNSSVISTRSSAKPHMSLNDAPQGRETIGSIDGLTSPSFRSNLTSPSDLAFASPNPFERHASSSSSNSSSLLSPIFDSASNAPLLSPKEEAEAKEAKKNRKILDLEITNKSLLAINAGLEVTKLKQAREIRDLKRKVRQSLAGGSNINLDELLGKQKKKKTKKRKGTGAGDDEETGDYFQDADDFDEEGEDEDDQDEDEDDEDEAEDDAELNPELEQSHTRCKTLIDQMIILARKSILEKFQFEEESRDANGGAGGTKVLHPLELEQLEEEKRRKKEAEGEREKAHASGTKEKESLGESTINPEMSGDTETQDADFSISTSTSSSSDTTSQPQEDAGSFPTSSSNMQLTDVLNAQLSTREENLKKMKSEQEEPESGSDSDGDSDETSVATKGMLESQNATFNKSLEGGELHPDASID